ncbi:MAG: sulfite reductase subunit A [Chloroflexales bacterium]|nr:sulfite reductase subunit A [Chloroflexales bacterium]
MSPTALRTGSRVILSLEGLQQLIDVLRRQDYQVIGPTIRDGAVVYAEVESLADLPAGWTDEQDAGSYRLRRRADEALFGYSLAAQSWKRLLHPPRRRLWRAERPAAGGDFAFVEEQPELPRRAFLGVRSCELRAIAIQNTVFTRGPFTDPLYKAIHDSTFIVAVNCGHAGGTCFCTSMGTGPRARAGAGFDLALTELIDEGRHVFLVEVGSTRGARIMREVPRDPAEPADLEAAERVFAQTAASMVRALDTSGIKEFLYANADHPRWDDVANRCLACGNCTTVCPTCFCTTVDDTTDLSGRVAERWQRWDSCFTLDFSYIHGGSVRGSGRERYRQWLTHKLAAWIDQFDSSGCVGCGRCITWCPVGIDLTEEVRAMYANDSTGAQTSTLNIV